MTLENMVDAYTGLLPLDTMDVHGYGADHAADGELLGFRVIDSASSITYLTAQELSDIYYGHDGTTIVDPACVEVYGWQ